MGIESYWRYLFEFTGFNIYSWRLSHAMSHHLDINLDNDFEVSSIEPILNFMTNQPRNNTLVFIYGHIFYFMIAPLSYLFSWIGFIIKRDRIPHLIPLIQYIIMLYYNYKFKDNNTSIIHLLFYWMVMHAVSSYLLLEVSTPIHRSDHCWTEGDKGGTKCFLEHVLKSTRDYMEYSSLFTMIFLFEGFNDHRIHHLFPTLDISYVNEIKPIIIKYCQSNNMKHYFDNKITWFGLRLGVIRRWYKIKSAYDGTY